MTHYCNVPRVRRQKRFLEWELASSSRIIKAWHILVYVVGNDEFSKVCRSSSDYFLLICIYIYIYVSRRKSVCRQILSLRQQDFQSSNCGPILIGSNLLGPEHPQMPLSLLPMFHSQYRAYNTHQTYQSAVYRHFLSTDQRNLQTFQHEL